MENSGLDLLDHETTLADWLLTLSPKILPSGKSIIVDHIPDDVLDKIYRKDVKFADKVKLIKPYLRQPNRIALVERLPTADTEAVRLSVNKRKLLELIYALRAVAAIFPVYRQFCEDAIVQVFDDKVDEPSDDILDRTLKFVKELRGRDKVVSAVISAASKLFYTVDGMAFDEFSMNLTPLE